MSQPPRRTLTARTPEDLLALVPVVLGFRPERSLVMLTFGVPSAFHARVDLPTTRREVNALVRVLLEPVLRHRVPRVVFVLYGPDSPVARALAHRLVRVFPARGVAVMEVLRADRDHWFALEDQGWAEGVEYDVSAHPFAAEAVLQGVVTHESRAALAATVAADEGQVALVEDRLARLTAAPVDPDVEGDWLTATVRTSVAEGRVLRPGQVARLLVALQVVELRDRVWLLMTRPDARDHVRFWSEVVRCAPAGLVAPPAALLAFAAWLSGHGALAWCALDRCAGDDDAYPMASGVAALLSRAVPPSTWEEGWIRPGSADGPTAGVGRGAPGL